MTMQRAAYNLMVVDDEPVFRLALRSLLSNNPLQINLLLEATNGKEALRMVQERKDIDIVIVDIQMPVCNGLDFLRALDAMPHKYRPAVIMLSAYNDYPYVRDAFLLGAVDYILKVDIDKERVFKVLEKVINAIQTKRTNDHAEHTESTKSRILLQLLIDAMNREWLEHEEISLNDKNKAVAVVRPDCEDWAQDRMESAGSEIYSIIDQAITGISVNKKINFEIVKTPESDYVLFFNFMETESFLYYRNLLAELMNRIKIRLFYYGNTRVSIGVSDVEPGEKDWRSLYQKAKYLVEMRFYYGLGKVFFTEALNADNRIECSSHVLEEFEALKRKAIELLLNGGDWKSVFHQWRIIRFVPHHFSQAEILALFETLVWDMGVAALSRGNRREMEAPAQEALKQLQECETVHQIWDAMFLLFSTVFDLLHSGTNSSAHKTLVKAKILIDEHYQDDITLSLISEMVGVSESYLSKLFVKETGKKFIEYLTNKRLEEAMKLMKGDMKLYEISMEVGYQNPEYFSRVFKKATGLTPIQYRSNTI